jgi:hypothetical protein
LQWIRIFSIRSGSMGTAFAAPHIYNGQSARFPDTETSLAFTQRERETQWMLNFWEGISPRVKLR